MATTAVQIDDDGVFHLIADGAVNSSVFLQCDDSDPVKIAIATALPSPTTDNFIILEHDTDGLISVTLPLLPTEKIYGKAYSGTGNGAKVRVVPLGVTVAGQGAGSPIMSKGIIASASFTPTAAAYSAGAIFGVAQALAFTTAIGGQPVPAGTLMKLLSTVLKIDATALQASEAAYNMALYDVTPPSAQANLAVWTLASADLPSYRGTIPVGTPVDAGNALFIKVQQTDQQFIKLGTGGQLFGELITVPAFTPTAIARQITVYGEIV